jgi:50S ribosomal protein L16 3-hydroxylase
MTSVLGAFFSGRGRARFLQSCWPNQHRHLYCHAAPGRLRGLIDAPELLSLPRLAELHHELIAQNSKGGGTMKAAPFAGTHLRLLLEAGIPVDFRDVQKRIPAVARWGDRLGRELGLASPCICNVFVSPDRHGLDKHFDDKDVFVVGVSGRKTFYVAPNRDVVHPLHNGGPMFRDQSAWLPYSRRRPSDRMPRGTARYEVTPGSVLFIPRGYWHKTVSRGLSWSISIGFQRPTWLALVREEARRQLARRPEWARPASGGWSPDPAVQRRALARFQSMLRGLDGALDLAELRRAAARWSPR